jgi:hypothetical protein
VLPPNIELNWNVVAGFLNLDKADALPVTVDCPLCHAVKSMVAYQDTTNNVGWQHCKACKHNGDFVELLAACWNMTIDATFVELGKRAVPSMISLPIESIRRYQEQFIAARHKATDAWAACESYFRKPPMAVNAILNTFNLSQRKWESFVPKLERYIAANHNKELEKALGSPYKHYVGTSRKKHLYDRIITLPVRFPGGWGDVLVLPYELAPGLIQGMLCVGNRHGKLQRLYTRCRTSDNTFNSKARPNDAGLWGLSASILGQTTCGDYAIALEDPLIALRIQSRHALMSTTPLPIVSWFFEPHQNTQTVSWLAVKQKNIVIVGCAPTPSVIQAAYSSGGMLALLDMTDAAFAEMIKTKKPEDLMRYIIRRALPWRDALRKWLTAAPSNKVKEFFNALLLANIDVDEIANEYKDWAQEHTVIDGVKCVRLFDKNKAWLVVENKDGWFIRLAPTDFLQMTNFSVRLKSICQRGIDHVAESVLWFKGEALPVTFSKTELADENQFQQKIITTCIDAGLGLPKINSGDMSLRRISRLFQEPKIYQYPGDVEDDVESDLLPIDDATGFG